MARLDTRLELRLDSATYERLERRAAVQNTSVAHLVRQAIRHELADDDRDARSDLLERGLSLLVPVPADPEELVRELDSGFDLPPDGSTGGRSARGRLRSSASR